MLAYYNDQMLTKSKLSDVEQELDGMGRAVAWGVENWLEGQINLTEATHHSLGDILTEKQLNAVLSLFPVSDHETNLLNC